MFWIFRPGQIIFISRTGLIWTANSVFDCPELVVRHCASAVYILTSSETLKQVLTARIDVTNVMVRRDECPPVPWVLTLTGLYEPAIIKIGHETRGIDEDEAERIIEESIY